MSETEEKWTWCDSLSWLVYRIKVRLGLEPDIADIIIKTLPVMLVMGELFAIMKLTEEKGVNK